MNETRERSLRELERRLGHRFADLSLLDNALTHRSFVNENAAWASRTTSGSSFSATRSWSSR
jgi:dsRNA-specific ribonuclease